MTAVSQIDWKAYLAALRLPDEAREALHTYGMRLSERGFPVIFDFSHLSTFLDIDREFLKGMINSPDSFYRVFAIPKRRGGERIIAAPLPSLLEVQQWINEEILSKWKIHEAAQAFVKNGSVVKNATLHLNQRAFLRIDLKDFFPSISLRRVLAIFRSAGYTPSVSYHLAALCTLNKALPQGAASSPSLSNIVVRRLDRRLSLLAAQAALNYSRYADDLIFSGTGITLATVDLIGEIVRGEGFQVNESKTILAIGRKKKIVTGISVSGEELKLPRSTRRSLRQQFYFVKRRGVLDHMERTHETHPLYIESLIGKFIFWRQVEPQNQYVADAIHQLRELQNDLDKGKF